MVTLYRPLGGYSRSITNMISRSVLNVASKVIVGSFAHMVGLGVGIPFIVLTNL